METQYKTEVDNSVLEFTFNRIGNQIFRALPAREEGEEWKKPLETICVEVSGISNILPDNEDIFTLLCKIKGLIQETDDNFLLYRRSIFECCSLANKIKKSFSK